MRLIRLSITFLFMGSLALLAACASVAPVELVHARTAYQRASMGPAAQLKPAELHKAKDALDQAEQSFKNDPDSARTKDLSYVAERKVQLAEALAGGEGHEQEKVVAQQDLQAKQGQMMQKTKGQLATTRTELAAAQHGLEGEAQGRIAAEKQAADADERAKQSAQALADLAGAREEQRGLVITLSGSVLFASNEATLLPEAQTRLGQVADALLATKERNLIIEGHTDSRGSESYNLELSQRRADAVRSYLVSRGYEGDRIQAHGIGKARPLADNKTSEGRANNRRVEIIVGPLTRAER